jgi:hypothetical protein
VSCERQRSADLKKERFHPLAALLTLEGSIAHPDRGDIAAGDGAALADEILLTDERDFRA